MSVPECIRIYHIVHVDRLPSILSAGGLLCDAEVVRRNMSGTTIGMDGIKHRRLYELTLRSHPDIHVGDCVPFYFCPRSVMLYLISRGNHHDLHYRGGQEPIVHLVADLHKTLQWADENHQRWAFTSSNAGSCYFEDYSDLTQLDAVQWDAVKTESWHSCKEAKQAEFLLENHFPWHLLIGIGVQTERTEQRVNRALIKAEHKPLVKILPQWYY
ncbi:MAG: DUF4433 domain-containing protein [Desulfovibrio sp.]|nr:DUF4433 domain-containing protein [Desulfovibrio sp.]